MKVERFKKWWPIALFLLITSLIGGVGSSIEFFRSAYGDFRASQTTFVGAVCNDNSGECAEQNQKFVDFLFENIGQESTFSIEYFASSASEFQQICESWGDEIWDANGVGERGNPRAVELAIPLSEMPCDKYISILAPPESLRLVEDIQGSQSYKLSGIYLVGYTKVGTDMTFLLSK
ncbi:hypothetical protein [Parerythrobacter jejuensis]|uniref:hypothetical protein n=1 Tax=Parerythrobacter jejuensis TaxID=795812 RepID=UPI0013707D8D|nr:hypothetical protein [Parerythrobacter jejuensis]